jgi:hypothetical protein
LKCPSKELRAKFLEANRLYMLDSMEAYMNTFHKVCASLEILYLSSWVATWQLGIYSCLHICSLQCTLHVQPLFQSLVDFACDKLQELFSPLENFLDAPQEMPISYLTCEHLFLSRIVGLTQFELYFSYLLLSRPMKSKVNMANF